MSEVLVQTSSPERVVSAVLWQLNHGQIEDATACFASEFQYKDHGIGLEFTDIERLAEFFRKALELYPDSSQETDRILVSGDYVVTQWTLRATLTEPLYGKLSRKVKVSLPGISIVRVANGEITDWTDYYDGLTSRRTALAAYFEEWVAL